MARPLSFVRLDIAHFGIEISDRPDDKTLADWVRKFHRSLALQDPTICEFGAKLLNECVEFRAIDANRKRIPKDSNGIRRKDMESTTDQIISEHIKTDKEVPEVSGPVTHPNVNSKKKEFEESSTEMKAAKYFWEHVKVWSPSAKEPSPAGFQKWAKDFDLIMRIDERSKDDIKDLIAWIDDKRDDSKKFSWSKVVLSPATLREKWNEGKFSDFVKIKPEKERSIYDIIPNLRMPNENGEYV